MVTMAPIARMPIAIAIASLSAVRLRYHADSLIIRFAALRAASSDLNRSGLRMSSFRRIVISPSLLSSISPAHFIFLTFMDTLSSYRFYMSNE